MISGNRKILGVTQGSEEWVRERNAPRTYCASDAAAMLGLSKHETRDQLMRRLAACWKPEGEYFQQKIFAYGHAVEDATRPKIEEIIESELFPEVGILIPDGCEFRILASADGLTMDGSVLWECKQWNGLLAEILSSNKILPATHWPQVQQGLMVFDADKCLFTTANENSHVDMEAFPDNEYMQRILDGWKQFDSEMQEYLKVQPEPEQENVIPARIETLPALSINVTGKVLSSNLDVFKEKCFALFNQAPTSLQTDQDFADAEQAVKWFKDAEQRLDEATRAAMAQTADIDLLLQTLVGIRDDARQRRLALEKQVKQRKESIKYEITLAARKRIEKSLDDADAQIIPYQVPVPHVDFSTHTKGLKTIDSFQNAVDRVRTEAQAEIARELASMKEKIRIFRERTEGNSYLFPDAPALLKKPIQDLKSAITARFAAAKEIEKRKEEQRKKEEQQELSRHDEKWIPKDKPGYCPLPEIQVDENIDLIEIQERNLDEKIDAFIKAQGYKPRTAKTVRGAIISWENFL